MAESYYPDTESDAGPDAGSSDRSPKPDMGESETALLPRSMFGGKEPKPGEEYIFKVEHIYSDEIEVSYSKGEEEGGEQTGSDTPEQAFDSKFSMMEGG